jgi:hypothetical protein
MKPVLLRHGHRHVQQIDSLAGATAGEKVTEVSEQRLNEEQTDARDLANASWPNRPLKLRRG